MVFIRSTDVLRCDMGTESNFCMTNYPTSIYHYAGTAKQELKLLTSHRRQWRRICGKYNETLPPQHTNIKLIWRFRFLTLYLTLKFLPVNTFGRRQITSSIIDSSHGHLTLFREIEPSV